MKTVILCGGFGTRIRDVTSDIPKPMIPIGGKPILWHIMKSYSHWNFNDFILCLGYKSEVIKTFFLNYEAMTRDFTLKMGKESKIEFHTHADENEWSVVLAETGQKSMTGARIKRVQRYLSDEKTFMLTYGDGVGDINIDELLKFHRSHGKTLTVTGVRPPGRFGEIVANDEGRIMEFNEKPQASGGRISGGFFVCERKIFDYLDESEGLVFEEGPMRKLVQDGEMMIYKHNGFWQPMDTSREYSFLNKLYDEGRAPWINW